MTGGISSRTRYTKLNFNFPYVRSLSLRRDTFKYPPNCISLNISLGNMSPNLLQRERDVLQHLIISQKLYHPCLNMDLRPCLAPRFPSSHIIWHPCLHLSTSSTISRVHQRIADIGNRLINNVSRSPRQDGDTRTLAFSNDRNTCHCYIFKNLMQFSLLLICCKVLL